MLQIEVIKGILLPSWFYGSIVFFLLYPIYVKDVKVQYPDVSTGGILTIHVLYLPKLVHVTTEMVPLQGIASCPLYALTPRNCSHPNGSGTGTV